MAEYQILDDTTILRRSDGASIPREPANRHYQRFLEWERAGGVIDPADRAPEPAPSRDERLLAAVAQAKALVGSGGFTDTQATKLAAVFDGLGTAITGGSP